MSKQLITIVFAASVAFAPLVLAPAAAMGQSVTVATPPREGVITAARMTEPKAVAAPANSKSAECASEASAKGLRGKPRTKFIAKCRKTGNGH
jgi:hypothetical protein